MTAAKKDKKADSPEPKVAPVEQSAPEPAPGSYKDNPDKPDESTVAQVEV